MPSRSIPIRSISLRLRPTSFSAGCHKPNSRTRPSCRASILRLPRRSRHSSSCPNTECEVRHSGAARWTCSLPRLRGRVGVGANLTSCTPPPSPSPASGGGDRVAPPVVGPVPTPALIRAQGLSKTYFTGSVEVTALNGLDFEIFDGEFVSVVGRSGCGKSTLLKLLAGLLPFTTGSVELDGKPL